MLIFHSMHSICQIKLFLCLKNLHPGITGGKHHALYGIDGKLAQHRDPGQRR